MKSLPFLPPTSLLAGLLSGAVLLFSSPPVTAQIMDVNGATAGFGNYTNTPNYVWDSGTTDIWTDSTAGTAITGNWTALGGGASKTVTLNATASGGFSTTTVIQLDDSFSVAGITKIGQPTLQLTSNATRTITLSPGALIRCWRKNKNSVSPDSADAVDFFALTSRKTRWEQRGGLTAA